MHLDAAGQHRQRKESLLGSIFMLAKLTSKNQLTLPKAATSAVGAS